MNKLFTCLFTTIILLASITSWAQQTKDQWEALSFKIDKLNSLVVTTNQDSSSTIYIKGIIDEDNVLKYSLDHGKTFLDDLAVPDDWGIAVNALYAEKDTLYVFNFFNDNGTKKKALYSKQLGDSDFSKVSVAPKDIWPSHIMPLALTKNKNHYFVLLQDTKLNLYSVYEYNGTAWKALGDPIQIGFYGFNSIATSIVDNIVTIYLYRSAPGFKTFIMEAASNENYKWEETYSSVDDVAMDSNQAFYYAQRHTGSPPKAALYRKMTRDSSEAIYESIDIPSPYNKKDILIAHIDNHDNVYLIERHTTGVKHLYYLVYKKETRWILQPIPENIIQTPYPPISLESDDDYLYLHIDTRDANNKANFFRLPKK